MTNLPELPDEYAVHMATMGISIKLDPLLPAGTFILGAHGLGPKYFDANTGVELTREEFMAMPVDPTFEGWRLDPGKRMAFIAERPKDL